MIDYLAIKHGVVMNNDGEEKLKTGTGKTPCLRLFPLVSSVKLEKK
jgi:hypothetical protein